MAVMPELICERKSEVVVIALLDLPAVLEVSDRPSDGEVSYVDKVVTAFVGAELNVMGNWLGDEVTVLDSNEAVISWEELNELWEDVELCLEKISTGLLIRSAAGVDGAAVDATTAVLELVSICGEFELLRDVIFEISVAPFAGVELCPSVSRLVDEVTAVETKEVAPGEVLNESCDEVKLPLELEKK